MLERGWLRQACAAGWKILSDFPSKQARFLVRPDRFIEAVDLDSWGVIKDAFANLVLGGTLALLINKINLSFYDDRITRVIAVQGKAENEIFLLFAVGAFALVSFAAFRVLGGRGSLVATGAALMYAIGFASPIGTLLAILVTRIVSVVLGATLVVAPPLNIVQLSYPDPSALATAVDGLYSAIKFGWNLYLSYLLWLTLRTTHRVGRWRGGVSTIAAVAVLYLLGGPLGYFVDRIVEPLRPVLGWVL